MPESPTPPKGVRKSRRNQQFTQVIPTRSFSATRCPRFKSVVHTEAARPYFVSFAFAMASSSRIEWSDVTHGPENLFFHATRGFRQSRENRRLNIETIVASVAE